LFYSIIKVSLQPQFYENSAAHNTLFNENLEGGIYSYSHIKGIVQDNSKSLINDLEVNVFLSFCLFWAIFLSETKF
jgi:hypothetical protein